MAKHRKIILIILSAIVLLQCLLLAAYFINRNMEKRSYRLVYEDEIQKYSAQFDLDFFLVAAVIHVESRNDPEALSPKGAMGLMQIMPDTGAWIEEKISGEKKEFDKKCLYRADTSIAYGCWYLRYLLDKFEGNTRYALIAYNAGPGNLDKWLKDERFSAQGRLTVIPFAQTEDYIKKVFGAKEKYEELYGKGIYQDISK